MAVAFTTMVSTSHIVAGPHAPLPFFEHLPENPVQESSFLPIDFTYSYDIGMPRPNASSVNSPASGSTDELLYRLDMGTQMYQDFDGFGSSPSLPGTLHDLLETPSHLQFGTSSASTCEFMPHLEDLIPWPGHCYDEITGDNVMGSRSEQSGPSFDNLVTQNCDKRPVDTRITCDYNYKFETDDQACVFTPDERSVGQVFHEPLRGMDAQTRLDDGCLAGEDLEDYYLDMHHPPHHMFSGSSHLPRAAKALSDLARPNTVAKSKGNSTLTQGSTRPAPSGRRESIKISSKRRSLQRNTQDTEQPLEPETNRASGSCTPYTPCVEVVRHSPTSSHIFPAPNRKKLVWTCSYSNCDHVFRRLTDAKRHTLAHSNIQIACPGCLNRYSRIDPLKRHAKKCQEDPDSQKSLCATYNPLCTDKNAWNEGSFLERATFVETHPSGDSVRLVSVKWI